MEHSQHKKKALICESLAPHGPKIIPTMKTILAGGAALKVNKVGIK